MNATSRARIHGWLVITALAAVAFAHAAAADQPAPPTGAQRPTGAATAQYLANAAVLVTNGGTKVVFDPLFRNDFGSYERVPDAMERALFAGEPPFDGLDAVFVSHYHEDHFSAIDVLRLLEARPDVRLYAPAQAVAGMREIASARLDAVIGRVSAIALQYQDAPVSLAHGPLLVEAVRVPHSGWPARQQQVENIAFRVTLDTETTVVHLGDADASDAHFARDSAHWSRRRTDVTRTHFPWTNSHHINGDLRTSVQRLKDANPAGVLLGSGKLATELDRLDLIDEYKFLVHPRIAGHGPTLHQSGLPSTRRLELVSARPLGNGAVAMHHRRAR